MPKKDGGKENIKDIANKSYKNHRRGEPRLRLQKVRDSRVAEKLNKQPKARHTAGERCAARVNRVWGQLHTRQHGWIRGSLQTGLRASLHQPIAQPAEQLDV
jgi:hypothetical protein